MLGLKLNHVSKSGAPVLKHLATSIQGPDQIFIVLDQFISKCYIHSEQLYRKWKYILK